MAANRDVIDGESLPTHRAAADERTSLLAVSNSDNHGTVEDNVVDDEGTDIDPNDFDILLSRSESITTGLGFEPESQETAMLRGPRKYSTIKGLSHRSSNLRRSMYSRLLSITSLLRELVTSLLYIRVSQLSGHCLDRGIFLIGSLLIAWL